MLTKDSIKKAREEIIIWWHDGETTGEMKASESALDFVLETLDEVEQLLTSSD